MANRISIFFLTLSSLAIAMPVSSTTLNGAVKSDGMPLTDVVVTVTSLSKDSVSPQTKTKPVTMTLDQKSKEFIPHVLPVRTGTEVIFPNSDNIQHHVYSFSSTKRFEIKLYKGTPNKPIVFNQPGLVALGCNIHDWMLGYVFITDTPYFTKTDNTGRWFINVPDGDYQISLWHPNAKNPDALPNEKLHVPSIQPLLHNIALKSIRPSGKPPATLQMQGYHDGF